MTGGGNNVSPSFVPFRPPWWLAWRQLQTWGASLAPLGLPEGMPLDEPHDISVAPGSRVRVLVTHAAGAPQGTLLLCTGWPDTPPHGCSGAGPEKPGGADGPSSA